MLRQRPYKMETGFGQGGRGNQILIVLYIISDHY
jgi:hypothetical protein